MILCLEALVISDGLQYQSDEPVDVGFTADEGPEVASAEVCTNRIGTHSKFSDGRKQKQQIAFNLAPGQSFQVASFTILPKTTSFSKLSTTINS